MHAQIPAEIADAQLSSDRSNERGEPTARFEQTEAHHWQALLLFTWRPSLPTSVGRVLAPSAEETLDPGAYDDPTGSGLPWQVPATTPVQP